MLTESSPPPGHPSEQQIQDADNLGLQLVRLGRMMAHAKTRFVKHQGDRLETAAYLLLVHLLGDGPQRITTLADAVHSDTSTVSRQVAALVRHGLAERRADPQDGRACLLAATGKGEQELDGYRRERNEAIACMLSDWPREDIQQLIRLLDRMNTELENFPLLPVRDEGETR